MRRFFADPAQISETSVQLSAEETHHLRDVLRLAPGDEVHVFDGSGRERACRVVSISKNGSVLEITAEVPAPAPESPLGLTLIPTVLSGERFDLIVQKAVELGVRHLIPMHTRRGDVKVADARRRVGRWKRIAMEATKQCGRARLMTVGEPATFDELIHGRSPGAAILFSERDGGQLPPLGDSVELSAFMGPKGGWDDSELELAADLGVPIVTLGGRILRAETAAIALTAILQHRFGDLR